MIVWCGDCTQLKARLDRGRSVLLHPASGLIRLQSVTVHIYFSPLAATLYEKQLSIYLDDGNKNVQEHFERKQIESESETFSKPMESYLSVPLSVSAQSSASPASEVALYPGLWHLSSPVFRPRRGGTTCGSVGYHCDADIDNH